MTTKEEMKMTNEKVIAMDVKDMDALARLCDTPQQRERREKRRMQERYTTEIRGAAKLFLTMAVGAICAMLAVSIIL